MRASTIVPPGRRLLIWGLILALVGVGTPWLRRENFFSEGGATPDQRPLPPFPEVPSAWVGGAPLTNADLHGRVWVLAVWTFGCVNCVRSIPYMNSLVERFGADVGVLGIHSPEFDWERDPVRLEAAIRDHGMRFPTYVDQSLDYFFALEVSAWPAFYVVDRETRIRGALVRRAARGHAPGARAGGLAAPLDGRVGRFLARSAASCV